MNLEAALAEIDNFLDCPTPQSWIEQAPDHLPELLADHANCEKKAASTALSLMYRYRFAPEVLQALSKLAREELRHFEQVLAMMGLLQIDYLPLSASSYAASLRSAMRTDEPVRLIDTLLVCAIVEARSCERFWRLLPVLTGPLAEFYRKLLSSEARHYRLYLDLARTEAERCNVSGGLLDERLAHLLAVDARSVCGEAPSFRFHSGALSPAATSAE